MHSTFEQLVETLGKAVAPLDAVQTQLRPVASPQKWTSQQIIEHLLLTYGSTCHAIEVRLAKGTPTSVTATLRQRLLQILVVRLGLFPHGRTAPVMVTPPVEPEPLSGEHLTQKVRDQVAELDELFTQAETAYGNRRSITHKILGPLSPRQWRRFHLLHARHHAKQIIKIRSDHNL